MKLLIISFAGFIFSYLGLDLQSESYFRSTWLPIFMFIFSVLIITAIAKFIGLGKPNKSDTNRDVGMPP